MLTRLQHDKLIQLAGSGPGGIEQATELLKMLGYTPDPDLADIAQHRQWRRAARRASILRVRVLMEKHANQAPSTLLCTIYEHLCEAGESGWNKRRGKARVQLRKRSGQLLQFLPDQVALAALINLAAVIDTGPAARQRRAKAEAKMAVLLGGYPTALEVRMPGSVGSHKQTSLLEAM